jgi:uncharacterized protein (TIGR02996 family)
MQEEQLLTAVNASPWDEATRLVYADWLLDQNRERDADLARRVVLWKPSEMIPGRYVRFLLRVKRAPDINGMRLHRRGPYPRTRRDA